MRAGDPGERVVMQFGKAEADAFILDFNPTGVCYGCTGFEVQGFRVIRVRRADAFVLDRTPTGGCMRAQQGGWPEEGGGGGARESRLECYTAAPAAGVPMVSGLTLASPSTTCCPAVLTAAQAFGCVISTFSSKLFL